MNKSICTTFLIFILSLGIYSFGIAQQAPSKDYDSFLKQVPTLYAKRQLIIDSITLAQLPPPPPPIDYDTVLVLSLLRTPCYGACPHYEFWIYASGRTVYEGRAHVDSIGRYETYIDSNKVVQLAKAAQQINYYNFSETYPPTYNSKLSDFPLCVTSVFWENQKKTVYNRNFAPPALVRYEKLLDEAIESIEKWEKVEK